MDTTFWLWHEFGDAGDGLPPMVRIGLTGG
jgi:hypothetical protein